MIVYAYTQHIYSTRQIAKCGEENYAYLADEDLIALVKYSTFHRKKSAAWRREVSKLENWSYLEADDVWICPNGQRLTFRYESTSQTEGGYTIRIGHHRSPDCGNCPFRAQCTKAAGDREIRVSQRVFGQMKNNRGFRRFLTKQWAVDHENRRAG